MDGGAVRIKVKGRMSPDLADSFGTLEVHDEPRHTVIITSADHLVSLLQDLTGRGVVVDRITPLD